MPVRRATASDIAALSPLFDGYRVFYGQPSDPERARRFLSERLERRESVIFIAESDGGAVGFTQLYPSFSSSRMALIFVLNDLFVAPERRGEGFGRALLAAAGDHGRAAGAVRLTLSTAVDNTAAQAVYEANGWRRNEAFLVYDLALGEEG
jgi:ribosomal protein S18 acetylase RimI-like enzyme